ncbi:MAG TPA: NifB/NifX family molybdenum-iron cluster-binding protein [Methanoregulaceae archaeon]|nr:NifB/NifX family molybdenum-iron cluster-binding protein [Methanoregulaceae archaeon]
MKIGIANDEGMVSSHFGHCREYSIYTVENGIFSRTDIPNPGHQPGVLPALLRNEGVTCVIARGMGPKAVEIFASHGIRVILGVSGEVDAILHDYLAGNIDPGESTCHHQ